MKLIDVLTEEFLREMFDTRTYQRGLNYFMQNRVVNCEFDPHDDILYAWVQGSQRNCYEQEVLLDGFMEIAGTCTCPMEYNCKHVVAALLTFMHSEDSASKRGRASADVKDDLDIWRNNVINSLETKQHDPFAHGDYQLTYVLECIDEKLMCRLICSRRLKRGAWGKQTPFYLYQLQGWNSQPRWLRNEDMHIISLLGLGYSLGSEFEVTGDVGFIALRKMLATRRCFYAELCETPLSMDSPRSLTLEWKQDDAQMWELIWKVEGDASVRPIFTDPPCYLDPAQLSCGKLRSEIPAHKLRLLSQMPFVSKERAEDISIFMLQNLAHEHVPVPVQVSITDADKTCVPHLRLLGIKTPNKRILHVARVCFEYHPLTLKPQTSVNPRDVMLVEHEENYWRVIRDDEVERQVLECLEDFGFSETEEIGVAPSTEFDMGLPATSIEACVVKWKAFINHISVLEEKGWKVEIEPSFQLEFVEAEKLALDVRESSAGWFDVGLEISFEGRKIALLPLVIQYLEQGESTAPLLIELEGGRWLECPRSVVQPVVETLLELHDTPALDDSGALSLPTARVHALSSMEERLAHAGTPTLWRGGEELKALAERLRHFEGIENVPAPTGLGATLRDYQLKGLSWLQFLRDYAFGGILADDMGLGKTVQTLAHIMVEKEAGRLETPVLVVAPTSVLSTWRREAERFAPDLQVQVWHGPQRNRQQKKLPEQDLIITSYTLLQRDAKLFQGFEFHLLILDEAQAIKNPNTKVARAACAQPARHRLCLTGTPVENHLGELWSLFNFLMPGYLGNKDSFRRLFRNPIEKENNIQRRYELERRIHPFVLRRDKHQVATELPLKTTVVSTLEFEGAQARLYESVRSAMSKKVAHLLEQKGMRKSRIEILDALLKLRQVCCDPRLVKLESARKVKHSAKMERLLEMLETLLSEGRKILVFSQFTSMLSFIEEELRARDVAYTKLTGRTRKRDAAIQCFQNGDASVFLISLKAGGVGLNLTAADTVIHYDPWWNPAVENQATDRAYRIGQDKPVFVYKLVTQNTIEEKILELQEKKRQLADMVYRNGDESDPVEVFSGAELLALLEH